MLNGLDSRYMSDIMRLNGEAKEDTMTNYAVFAPGHGSQWLGAPGDRWGSGHLAYLGPSLRDARRTLNSMRAMVRRLRQQPDLRYVSDTYKIFVERDDRWEPLE